MGKLRNRRAAIDLLDALENDPTVEIIPVAEQTYERAFRLYRDRLDKEWGLTDCLSFIVMNERSQTDGRVDGGRSFSAGGFSSATARDLVSLAKPGSWVRPGHG